MSTSELEEQNTQIDIPGPPESGIRLGAHASEKVRSRQVTLVVYEWEGVEPGIWAWVFPSLDAARSAAAAMKNASKWAILVGARAERFDLENVDLERASGQVLAEAA